MKFAKSPITPADSINPAQQSAMVNGHEVNVAAGFDSRKQCHVAVVGARRPGERWEVLDTSSIEAASEEDALAAGWTLAFEWVNSQ